MIITYLGRAGGCAAGHHCPGHGVLAAEEAGLGPPRGWGRGHLPPGHRQHAAHPALLRIQQTPPQPRPVQAALRVRLHGGSCLAIDIIYTIYSIYNIYTIYTIYNIYSIYNIY